jgi:hypothetical protein
MTPYADCPCVFVDMRERCGMCRRYRPQTHSPYCERCEGAPVEPIPGQTRLAWDAETGDLRDPEVLADDGAWRTR